MIKNGIFKSLMIITSCIMGGPWYKNINMKNHNLNASLFLRSLNSKNKVMRFDVGMAVCLFLGFRPLKT